MRFLNKFSVRIQFFLFVIAFTLLPMVLAVLIIKGYLFYETDKIAEEYIDAVYQNVDNGFSEFISYIRATSNQILTFNPIYNLLSDGDDAQRTEKFRELMGLILSGRNDIYAVEVITADGSFVYPNNHLTQYYRPSEVFLQACTRTDITVDTQMITLDDKTYLAFGQRMFNFYSGADIGCLILYVDERGLYGTFDDAVLDGGVIYITADDIVVSHSDPSMLGYKTVFPGIDMYTDGLQKYSGSNNMFVFQKEMTAKNIKPNFQFVQAFSSDSVFITVQTIDRNISILVLALCVLAVLLSIFLPSGLLGGLDALKKKMLLYMEGRFSDGPELFKNETAVLYETFCSMIEKIDVLKQKNEMEMQQKKEAEIKALSSQIDPHFIYNALDTAVWTLKLSGVDVAEKLLRALGKYYRIGLHKGSVFVRVHEELEHVAMYIEIEQIRHKSRLFTVEYGIDEQIREYFMLKIILQPLVENCIKHGFRGMKENGRIRITGQINCQNGDLLFTVEDNGCGKVDALAESLVRSDSTSGYGLKNINDRLILEYGSDYGLGFSQSTLGGVCVSVRVKATKYIDK